MTSLVPLQDIEARLDSIDLSRLALYVSKLKTIDEASNKALAPAMMRDFIVAQDITSILLARAVQAEMMAKNYVETAEAIAYLDRSDDYFKARSQKPTADLRKAYVTLDPDVVAAKETLARAAAVAMLLKNRVYEFKSAYEAVKQIYKDTQQTPWEGM
jgi:hypothetical protein